MGQKGDRCFVVVFLGINIGPLYVYFLVVAVYYL